MVDGGFDWDDANTNHILDAHGVTPSEAEDAVLDPRRVTYRSDVRNEPRLAIIGLTAEGRLLTVIITNRPPFIRVVTAREANNWERQLHRRRSHKGRS